MAALGLDLILLHQVWGLVAGIIGMQSLGIGMT